MKRILHLTKFLPSFAGGIERATAGVAEAGRAAGAEVTIVGAGSVKGGPTPKHWLALPIAFRVGPVPIVPGYFRLGRLFDESDLIHVHLPNPVAEIALLSYLLKRALFPRGRAKRTSLVPIWHAPMVRWPRLGVLWSMTVHRLLYGASRAVMVASPQLAILGKKIHPSTDFHVLPFGIPSAEKVPQYTNLLREDSFHVVAVGRLVAYKGFNRLLEALSRLGGNWRLTIVGNGPQGTGSSLWPKSWALPRASSGARTPTMPKRIGSSPAVSSSCFRPKRTPNASGWWWEKPSLMADPWSRRICRRAWPFSPERVTAAPRFL